MIAAGGFALKPRYYRSNGIFVFFFLFFLFFCFFFFLAPRKEFQNLDNLKNQVLYTSNRCLADLII